MATAGNAQSSSNWRKATQIFNENKNKAPENYVPVLPGDGELELFSLEKKRLKEDLINVHK